MHEPSEPGLWDAYLRTSYCARTPLGLIRLRIGKASNELDKLLTERRARDWAYVSACNPASQPLSREENERRHQELVKMVRSLGKPFFPGEGIPDDGRWQIEASLLILDIAEDHATRLGCDFGQNAIVVGMLGGVPRLKSCRGQTPV
jgi:hypothetical protein